MRQFGILSFHSIITLVVQPHLPHERDPMIINTDAPMTLIVSAIRDDTEICSKARKVDNRTASLVTHVEIDRLLEPGDADIDAIAVALVQSLKDKRYPVTGVLIEPLARKIRGVDHYGLEITFLFETIWRKCAA